MVNIGDKFVIEIDDISKSGFGTEYYRMKGVEIFVTQSDLDKLEKLSYEEESKKSYNKGLNDAWNLIKKINSDIPCSALENIFGRDIYDRCDGDISDIIDSCTVEEALEKIKAWEQEEIKIKIGDEVRNRNGDIGVIIGMKDNALFKYKIFCLNSLMALQGSAYELTKTGRHFDEIRSLLVKFATENVKKENK